MDREVNAAFTHLLEQVVNAKPVQELKCSLCSDTFSGGTMLVAVLMHLQSKHASYFDSQQNRITSSSEVNSSQQLFEENETVTSSSMGASLFDANHADSTSKDAIINCDKETQTETLATNVGTQKEFVEPQPIPQAMVRFLCLTGNLEINKPYRCLLCYSHSRNIKTAFVHLVRKHNVLLRSPISQRETQQSPSAAENDPSLESKGKKRDRQTARKSAIPGTSCVQHKKAGLTKKHRHDSGKAEEASNAVENQSSTSQRRSDPAKRFATETDSSPSAENRAPEPLASEQTSNLSKPCQSSTSPWSYSFNSTKNVPLSLNNSPVSSEGSGSTPPLGPSAKPVSRSSNAPTNASKVRNTARKSIGSSTRRLSAFESAPVNVESAKRSVGTTGDRRESPPKRSSVSPDVFSSETFPFANSPHRSGSSGASKSTKKRPTSRKSIRSKT